MDSDGGYAIIKHQMVFSEAAAMLSTGGFTRLIEFVCHWWRESNYGERENVPVHFTFLSSSRFEHRSTWLLHRNELEQKGFICKHDKLRGTFEMGTAWRSYEPTAVEMGIMQKHSELQAKRSAMTTAKFRHGKTPTTPGDMPVPGLENAPGNEMTPGLKISPGKGSENATRPGLKIRHDPDRKSVPHRSINYNPLPPAAQTPAPETPTSKTGTSENPLVPGLPKRTIILNLLTHRIWPPPASALRDAPALVAWIEAELETGQGPRYEYWSSDEESEARRVLAELEARDAQRFQESTAAKSPLDKLVESCDGDESKLTVAVAAHLGDTSDYAVDRVRRVYNLVGPEALIRGAKTLLNDPSAPDADKRLKFLKHRASMSQSERMH